MAGRIGRRVYKTAAWRAARQAAFACDGWRCFKCGRRSGLECDHIRPIRKGGDWYDMANLRTVCRSCHIQLTREAVRKELPDPRRELRDMATSAALGR